MCCDCPSQPPVRGYRLAFGRYFPARPHELREGCVGVGEAWALQGAGCPMPRSLLESSASQGPGPPLCAHSLA
eukprot:9476769-Pyramimonas_sp.AAC.1